LDIIALKSGEEYQIAKDIEEAKNKAKSSCLTCPRQ